MTTEQNTMTSAAFRPPQPKPGLQIAPLSFFRKLCRSLGGRVAYLASWWRY
jgi:hypothetical protein